MRTSLAKKLLAVLKSRGIYLTVAKRERLIGLIILVDGCLKKFYSVAEYRLIRAVDDYPSPLKSILKASASVTSVCPVKSCASKIRQCETIL